MAKDYGPEELAALDARLASGVITPEVHEARRAALMAEIGRGKTIELSTGEKLVQAALVALGIIVTAVIIGLLSVEEPLPPLVTFFVLALGVAGALVVGRAYGRQRRGLL